MRQHYYPTMSATTRCNSACVNVPLWGIADRGGCGTNPLNRARPLSRFWPYEILDEFVNERKNFDKKVMIGSSELENNRAQYPRDREKE
jgi:hypothetical protein